jgi:molecular chaperone GrpE
MKDVNGVSRPHRPSLKPNIKTPALEAKLAEVTGDLQRARADFENYRKQSERQKTAYGESIRFATVKKFLPILDDISRAISAYPELKPLGKSLNKTIESLGLAEINSQPGVEFNHDLHEAVSVEEAGGDKETIAETLRPGYALDGQVLRPAMVKVRK